MGHGAGESVINGPCSEKMKECNSPSCWLRLFVIKCGRVEDFSVTASACTSIPYALVNILRYNKFCCFKKKHRSNEHTRISSC